MVYKVFGEGILLDKYGNKTSKASFSNRGYTGHGHIVKQSAKMSSKK